MEKYILWNYNSGYLVIEAENREEAMQWAEVKESEYMGDYEEAMKDIKFFIQEEDKRVERQLAKLRKEMSISEKDLKRD